jgi:enterochelin esterase family protein
MTALRGRIETPLLRSAALRGNVLSDPTDREVLVYLPPSYDETLRSPNNGARRFPMVMVLPAFGAMHRTLASFRLWDKNVFEIYESLLARAECIEAILVVPDAVNRWGGSQFLDSAATGAYQTYLVDEVVPFVDQLYRTIPTRESRAIVGRSSGGFGALRIGIDRPDAFAAIGCHAGDALFDVSLRPGLTAVATVLDREGGLLPFANRMREQGPRGDADFEAIAMLAYAAAYAPNTASPFPHCDLPFDPETALLIPEVWARWIEHDPVVLLERFPAALSRASFVYLDAGNRDEHGLHFGARRLARLLRDRGVACVHEEFDGGHRNTTQRFANSLPKLIEVLAPL